MLTFPRENRRSVNAHNIDRPTFLDWLETTSIFTGEDFSRPTLVDYLLDQSWYSDQDFAWEFVQEMWDALQTRLSWLGAYSPISIDDGFVTFRWNGLGWKEVPAHSFCWWCHLVQSTQVGPRDSAQTITNKVNCLNWLPKQPWNHGLTNGNSFILAGVVTMSRSSAT